MNMKRMALVCCLALLLSWVNNSPTVADSWREQMLSSLNTMRADKGLKPLKLCSTLNKSAQDYAREMALQDFYAHEGKDGSTPGERIQRAGYRWRSSNTEAGIAENIAAGQGSVQKVMKDWKNSTGHFKNMTGSKFLHVGFGMATSTKSTYKKYWVQNFGYGARC
jgi:uncharacterized protein YkwD